jgi:tetratricopeptide (TPR) repeat protein
MVPVEGEAEKAAAGERLKQAIELREKYRETEDFSDLQMATEAAQRAVVESRRTGSDRALALSLALLSALLIDGANYSGSIGAINEAISLLQESLQVTPKDSPEYRARHRQLTRMLQARYEEQGRLQDPQDAAEVLRRLDEAHREFSR